jgi:hypothetical protein
MIGDMLLSGAPQSVPVSLPSRFIDGQPEANPSTVGLMQKIVVIDGKFVAAWSGDYDAAREVIEAIRDNSQTLAKAEDILPLIESLGFSEKKKKSFHCIFYSMSLDGNRVDLQIQDYRTGQTQLSPSQKVRYAGLGREHFLDNIGFNLVEGKGQFTDQSIMTAQWLNRCAIAFYDELETYRPHNAKYGGGFELLVVDGSRYKKVPYSLFFWRVDPQRVTLLPFCFSLQYTDYKTSFLRRIENVPGPVRTVTEFAVPSPLHEVPEQIFPDLNLDNIYCLHYLIGLRGFNSIIQNGESKGLQPYFKEDGTFDVEITEEFREEFDACIRRNRQAQEAAEARSRPDKAT